MRAALAWAALALLPACASSVYVQANVQGYGVDAQTLGAIHAMRIVSEPDAENPLRDNAVAELAAAELSLHGLMLDATADVELLATTSVSEATQWIPPQTRVMHSYHPGMSRRYRILDEKGERWIQVYEPGEWWPETWTTGGYTERVFTHRAEIRLRDSAGRVLWQGELSAVGPSGDFLAVMRSCMPLLFDEYPAPSGQPADRMIALPTSR